MLLPSKPYCNKRPIWHFLEQHTSRRRVVSNTSCRKLFVSTIIMHSMKSHIWQLLGSHSQANSNSILRRQTILGFNAYLCLKYKSERERVRMVAYWPWVITMTDKSRILYNGWSIYCNNTAAKIFVCWEQTQANERKTSQTTYSHTASHVWGLMWSHKHRQVYLEEDYLTSANNLSLPDQQAN